MRYYVFPGGTLKITDSTPLATLVKPDAYKKFKKVNLAVFYKLRIQEVSKTTASNINYAYNVIKEKAQNIIQAIKK